MARRRHRALRLRGRRDWTGAAVVAAAAVLGVAAGHAHGYSLVGPAAAGSAAQVSAGTSANVALAQHLASGYGWGSGPQWACLDELWTRENAAWDPAQWNLAGSGAYGIPQALPASKMASAGADWRTNAATQIRWGLGYIRDRYGSPTAAYQFWLSQMPHWYRRGGRVRAFANGGLVPEPVLGIGASGRAYSFDRGEDVQTAAQAAALAQRLDVIAGLLGRLIDTTAAVPAGVGRHVGGALGGASSDAAYRSRYPRGGW